MWIRAIMLNYLQLWDAVGKSLTTLYGWFICFAGIAATFLASEKLCFHLIWLVVGFDAVFGIIAAVKQRKFILSRLLRHTGFKIFAYTLTVIAVFFAEKLAHDSNFIGTKVITGAAILCEIWSFSASILIISPKFPFFRLFRKQLAGEIAAKMNIPVSEVENILDKQ